MANKTQIPTNLKEMDNDSSNNEVDNHAVISKTPSWYDSEEEEPLFNNQNTASSNLSQSDMQECNSMGNEHHDVQLVDSQEKLLDGTVVKKKKKNKKRKEKEDHQR